MSNPLQARCMKCKKDQPFSQDAEYIEIQTQRGLKAMHKGKCPVCGTTMCKIVPVRKTE